jgi:CheY-like chemotaxis protein
LARKILLADDSVTAQNMGRKILTDAGYEVVTVNNGSAALKKIAEIKPDLIVLDVYMPGYSGLEVCQRVKENRETARIPVLLTVGKLEPFKPEEARRARADAFVVKPFEASELLAALSKLEDKVIPQPEPYKQGRFAKAVASVDQDVDPTKFGDSDEGWKARLRIPTGPPKAKDPETEPDVAPVTGKGFRNFAEKPLSEDQPKNVPANAGFDRLAPAGIPHDITPEEIAALAAAAAQLSGRAPAPAPSQEDTSHKIAEVETERASASGSEETAPVTFANSPALAVQEAELHANHAQESPAGEAVGFAQAVPSVESRESTEAVAEVVHPVAENSEPPVPIAAEQASTTSEQSSEQAEHEGLTLSASEAGSETAPDLAAEPNVAASHSAEPTELPVISQDAGIASAPAVADDEVMAALQTLMPGPDGDGRSAEHPALGSAAEVGMTSHASDMPDQSGPRWIAEEVAVAGEEATLSLEDEMNRADGTHAIEGLPAAEAAESQPALSAVATETAPTETPASQTGDQPAMYAMASAAAGGETVAVPWTPSTNVSAHESSTGENAAAHEPVASPLEVAVNEAPPVAADGRTNEIVGGTDIMAANWKNIRDSIAGAAAKPAPSKEHFQEPETVMPEPEAAMPAAPERHGSMGATDPTAIANIVESVLAELRPKIVEEIARKLADPKKT